MPTETIEEKLKAYRADSRTACQYGVKCYQKNPAHHAKYKHPPKKEQKDAKNNENIVTGRKRSSSECDEDEAGVSKLPQAKQRKEDAASREARTHSLSPSPPPVIEDSSDPEIDDSSPETSPKKDSSPETNDSPEKNSLEKNTSPKKDSPEKNASPKKDSSRKYSNSPKKPSKNDNSPRKNSSPDKDSKSPPKNGNSEINSAESSITDGKNEEESNETSSITPSTDAKQIISDLFLVEMPVDFYKFYEFCASIYPKDPTTALKLVDLKLVGPFDVLNGRIKTNEQKDPQKYLRHWRYYYDPPEFQTILKGNDKEGLHYGYWRDVPEENPVFVAKNCANKDCTIVPVAPNIFAAVNAHIEERLKKANPFERGPILKLSKQLKAFALSKGIELEKDSAAMRDRNRKVVAKTFHRAGIVVPYDKKTQLGYRDLAATDSHIKRILTEIDEAESDDEIKKPMSKIEELVRLATIAADEFDFGTCLELGHDLFYSGCKYVQKTGLRMLASAYSLLNRQKFLKIAEAHANDRKTGCDLSIL